MTMPRGYDKNKKASEQDWGYDQDTNEYNYDYNLSWEAAAEQQQEPEIRYIAEGRPPERQQIYEERKRGIIRSGGLFFGFGVIGGGG